MSNASKWGYNRGPPKKTSTRDTQFVSKTLLVAQFINRMTDDNKGFEPDEIRLIRQACVPHFVAYQPVRKLKDHLATCPVCQRRLNPT